MDMDLTNSPLPQASTPHTATTGMPVQGTSDGASLPQSEPTFANILAAGLASLLPNANTAAKVQILRPGSHDTDVTDALGRETSDAAQVLAAAGLSNIMLATPPATENQAIEMLPRGQSTGANHANIPGTLPQPALARATEHLDNAMQALLRTADAATAASPAGNDQHLVAETLATVHAAVLPETTTTTQQAVRIPAMAVLHTAVNTSGWDAELGRTMVWMAHAQHSVAELRLNPPDLGPLEIMLKLGGDGGNQANVTFASPHAAVREVIESALPRLREMLADAGINLGQATVSAESFRQSDPERSGPQTRHGRDADMGAGTATTPAAANIVRTGTGIVDTFA